MEYTEEQKDKVAVKALEANIWKADNFFQEFFRRRSFEDIQIAHEYLTIREGTEDTKGTSPQYAIVLLSKKLNISRYELARKLIFMMPEEKIVPIDIEAVIDS